MIRGGRPFIILICAVWQEINEGNIEGARNRMSNWLSLDWSIEEAMIEEQQRKAA